MKCVKLLVITLSIVFLLVGCVWLQEVIRKPSQESRPITEEEAEAILGVQFTYGQMYDNLREEGDENAAESVALLILNEENVSETNVGEDGVVWIIYDSGLVGSLHPARREEPFLMPVQAQTVNDLSLAAKQPVSSGLMNTPGNTRAAFFVFPGLCLDNYATASDVLSNLGYSVDYYIDYDFTITTAQLMGEYGVLYILTHGSTSWIGSTWLLTGEIADSLSLAERWDVSLRDTIGVGTQEGISYFEINERFIQKLSFPNSLVFNSACSSFKYSKMADAFLDNGAASYLGWTNVSSESFSMYVSGALFSALSHENVTLSQALDSPELSFKDWPGNWSVNDLFPVEWWCCKCGQGGGVFANGLTAGIDKESCENGFEVRPTVVNIRTAGALDLVLNPPTVAAPFVTKTGGLEGAITHPGNTFTWTGHAPGGHIVKYQYRKDEGNWVSNGTSTSYTWSGYSEGDHKFEVRAQDNEGDYSNIISWSFTYSTGAVVVGEMVLVEGGTFTMGDTWGDGYSNELPVHQVTLTYDFEIGKYEVTFDEYDTFCDDTGRSKPDDYGWGRGTKPVIWVSWWDTIAYCNWLSVENGLPVAYRLKGEVNEGQLLDSNGNITTDITKVVGYRLPTEAEWEYAARGGKHHSPYKYSGSDNVSDVAWYESKSTHEVGTKAPNELGIHDMSGNVYERCSDWYGSYSSSAQTNPCNNSGSYPVGRGGSAGTIATQVRVAYRTSGGPDVYGNFIGFRIARTVP